MASPPTPQLTPFQRAVGHLGQQNAEFLFSHHHNPGNLTTVGDDAWGKVLQQTRDRVARQEERGARQNPPPEPTPEPPPPSPPPPPPAPPAPVSQGRPGAPERTTSSGVQSPSKRTGKQQLRTDRFAQSPGTGLQLPR